MHISKITQTDYTKFTLQKLSVLIYAVNNKIIVNILVLARLDIKDAGLGTVPRCHWCLDSEGPLAVGGIEEQ